MVNDAGTTGTTVIETDRRAMIEVMATEEGTGITGVTEIGAMIGEGTTGRDTTENDTTVNEGVEVEGEGKTKVPLPNRWVEVDMLLLLGGEGDTKMSLRRQ